MPNRFSALYLEIVSTRACADARATGNVMEPCKAGTLCRRGETDQACISGASEHLLSAETWRCWFVLSLLAAVPVNFGCNANALSVPLREVALASGVTEKDGPENGRQRREIKISWKSEVNLGLGFEPRSCRTRIERASPAQSPSLVCCSYILNVVNALGIQRRGKGVRERKQQSTWVLAESVCKGE